MALIPLSETAVMPAVFYHGKHRTQATQIGDLRLRLAKVPGYGELEYATGETSLFVPCAHPGCTQEASELEHQSKYLDLKTAYLEYLYAMKSLNGTPNDYLLPEHWAPFTISCVQGHKTPINTPFRFVYNGAWKLNPNSVHNVFYKCIECGVAIPITSSHLPDVLNALRAMGRIAQ